MTCCALGRSYHFCCIQVAQHPDRTQEKHTGKILSRGLFMHLCRNLSASIRTTLPICYSFHCGCATDTRPQIIDFVWMRSPISAFWWADWRYFWGRPRKGSKQWWFWSWMRSDIRGWVELFFLSEGRHEGQLRAIILVEVIPKEGDVPAWMIAYLLYSFSWLISSMFMLLSCGSWGTNIE